MKHYYHYLVFKKIELSRSDWFDRIIALWRTHASLTREEAEMSYLKHSQDLDMFGLSFFEISKMQGANKSPPQEIKSINQQPPIAADLWLGIDSLGIRFYKKNKLRPEVFFSWCDIKSVTAHDKKVTTQNSFILKLSFVINPGHLKPIR